MSIQRKKEGEVKLRIKENFHKVAAGKSLNPKEIKEKTVTSCIVK